MRRIHSAKRTAWCAVCTILVLFSRGSGATATSSNLSAGLAALEESSYQTARKELETATRSPEAATAWIGLARVHLATGRYEDAAVAAQSALQTRGSCDATCKADAASARGEALARLGRSSEAISILEPFRREPSARRARLLLGELYLQTGRKADASGPLMSLIEDYNQNRITNGDAEGLSLVGRAAHWLGSARDANDAYNEAERSGKHRAETLLWRAELFLDKYDPGHAEEVVREALKIAPHNAQAHVLLARVKLDQALGFDAAQTEVEQAWSVNPKIQGAFFVAAGLALRTMDLARADAVLDRGLAANPGDLELLSMRAAVRFLADDKPGFERLKAEVFRKNPEFARFYAIVGEFAEWEHRYDEIVAMMKEAVRIDADDAKAWAELGLNAIRAGQESDGVSALRRAWQKDHFNVRVFNTLNLFEKEVATSYETVDAAPFRIRYHKDEKSILDRYVPRLLAQAWSSMTRRYGMVPPAPVTIELYATPEQFSVRTSGLPNIGIQGVCFGRTLATMSPRAQPMNWGNVLWHELSHVFAIQLSKSRVPRWFTEGLSEYETTIQRAEWQREEGAALYVAFKGGRIPPIERFNEAFTHFEDPSDLTTAYYAASQAVRYLVETHGMPKIVAMLRLWGEGKKTPEVLERGLGLTPPELDRRLRAWLEANLARYDGQFVPDEHAPALDVARQRVDAHPEDARAHVELAFALLRSKGADAAHKELDAALERDPLEANARFARAKLLSSAQDAASARRELAQLVRQGNDGYAVRMLLAQLAVERKDRRAAEAALKLAHDFDPMMAEPMMALADLTQRAGRRDESIEWLQRAAALEQHDRKMHMTLLSALVEAGRFAEAAREGEVALFVDVENPNAHVLYAKALSKTGDHARAVFELESALVLSPPKAEQAGIHAELAREYLALGHVAKARASRDEALRLDGANELAKSLKIP